MNSSDMHHGHHMAGMTTTMVHGHNMSGHSMGMPHGHDMSNMSTGHNMNMNHGGGGGSGHDMHMGGGMHMDGMKMYFHPGVSEYILFEDCHTSSVGGLIGACFVIFTVAVLYEGLKFLREVLLQRSLREDPRLMYGEKEMNRDVVSNESRLSNVGSRMFSSGHFLQTLLHAVQVFVSYCLMLVFMTYNVWLCLAVILGAGVGYFLFGWKRAVVVDSNEHCH